MPQSQAKFETRSGPGPVWDHVLNQAWLRLCRLGELTATMPAVALVAAILVVGYLFGYEFWSHRLGPIPLTIDRLGILFLLTLVGWQMLRGKSKPLCLTLIDWVLGATLLWLAASAWWGHATATTMLPQSPVWRLAFSFLIPGLLYLAIRLGPVSPRATTGVLVALALLGTYLAITGLAEVTRQWWAVFPTYIRNPELGTHFGRARGPALNSVSMGTHLAIAFWATYILLPRLNRPLCLLALGSMCLMGLAIVATYTRSVWLGAALGGVVMLWLQTPRHLRVPVAFSTALAGGLALAIGWNAIVYLDREDSGAVSGHSVSQREAFTYVSWNMFKDHPVAGVGFGRFYDTKLPYLSDRSQSFELESLRDLHHHNTFLGLLVETGLVGLCGYIAVLLGWCRIGLSMASSPDHEANLRAMGRFLLVALAVYLPSALFHDVSHIFQDQWLLFTIAGLAVATCEQSLSQSKPSLSLPRNPAPLAPTVGLS